MTMLQEYDLKAKPVKIVWSQGLCQIAAKTAANDKWENETAMYEPKSLQVVDQNTSIVSKILFVNRGYPSRITYLQTKGTLFEVC